MHVRNGPLYAHRSTHTTLLQSSQNNIQAVECSEVCPVATDHCGSTPTLWAGLSSINTRQIIRDRLHYTKHTQTYNHSTKTSSSDHEWWHTTYTQVVLQFPAALCPCCTMYGVLHSAVIWEISTWIAVSHQTDLPNTRLWAVMISTSITQHS